MLGCLDEFTKLFIGDRVLIHPKAIDGHFMRRRFFRIVLVGSHEKRAAGNPDHIRERWPTRFRLCLSNRSHGDALVHNFFLLVLALPLDLSRLPSSVSGGSEERISQLPPPIYLSSYYLKWPASICRSWVYPVMS